MTSVHLGFTLHIDVEADLAPMLRLATCARVMERFGRLAFLSLSHRTNQIEVRYFDFESVVRVTSYLSDHGPGSLRELLLAAHMEQHDEVPEQNPGEPDIDIEALSSGREQRCSVMVGQVPKTCTAVQFMQILDRFGFLRRLRFFYLPMDFVRQRGYGYLFLDFQSPSDVVAFSQSLESIGVALSAPNQNRRLHLQFSRMQGWRRLLRHYADHRHTFLEDANLRPQFLFPGADRNRNASYRDLLPEELRDDSS